jgi:hypothetical protein
MWQIHQGKCLSVPSGLNIQFLQNHYAYNICKLLTDPLYIMIITKVGLLNYLSSLSYPSEKDNIIMCIKYIFEVLESVTTP